MLCIGSSPPVSLSGESLQAMDTVHMRVNHQDLSLLLGSSMEWFINWSIFGVRFCLVMLEALEGFVRLYRTIHGHIR